MFILALAVRLALAPFTTLSATFENITAVDTIFVQGFNPLSWITSYGTGFYLFYAPLYIPYIFLNLLGVHSLFILEFLFKIPSIIGDMLSGYALFNLALRIQHDSRKATLLSGVYLLNPYTIFVSAVVGHLEPLMMGLLLMSLYWALQENTWKSSGFLSLASSLRFLPGLLLPFFLIFVRRRSPQSVKSYLGYFVAFSAILFSPYLLVIVPLGLTSEPLLFTYLQAFGGPVGTLGQSNPMTFKYNLTGFFASAGLWGYASQFSNALTFLVLYAVMIPAFWRFTTRDFKALANFAGVFFSTFMIVVPLSQAHYLSWFLPFALLGVFIYGSIPRQYVALLIGVNMAIWPIIDPSFLIVLDATFPWVTGYGYLYSHWPFLSLDLQLSLSVLYVVILAFCLVTLLLNAVSFSKFDSSTQRLPRGRFRALEVGQIAVLVFETLRLVYFQSQAYLWPLAIIAALSILAIYVFQSRPIFNSDKRYGLEKLPRKKIILLGLSGLMFALGLNGNSVFLLIQAFFLVFLAVTKESHLGSTLTQVTILWCVGYAAYLSLASANSSEAILTVLALFVILSASLSQFFNTIRPRTLGMLPKEGR